MAAISLGLVLGLTACSLAADPVPLPVGQPTPTTWNKMPALPPVPVPPPSLPPVANPPAPYRPVTPADAPNGTVPGRTVTFQKPPGADSTIPTVGPIPVPTAPVPQPPPTVGKIDDGKPAGKTALPSDKETPPTPKKSADIKSDPQSLPSGLQRSNVFKFVDDRALKKRVTMELIDEARQRPVDDNRKTDPAQQAVTYSTYPTARDLAPEGVVYQPKTITQNYEPRQMLIEPAYVVHRRLYFEEKNSERYGWELGIAQPAISALTFYGDLLLYPSRLGSNLFERYDTSAGKCLPGSPVPYFLYPPEIDLFGATFGAATIVGTAVGLFP